MERRRSSESSATGGAAPTRSEHLTAGQPRRGGARAHWLPRVGSSQPRVALAARSLWAHTVTAESRSWSGIAGLGLRRGSVGDAADSPPRLGRVRRTDQNDHPDRGPACSSSEPLVVSGLALDEQRHGLGT